MRLIDADALKKALIECTPYVIDPVYRNTNSNIDIFTAMEILDELPTIDAVPVVRGAWIVDECDTTDDVPSSSWIDFHCSECSMEYGLEEGQYGWCRDKRIPYKYCPNCGAKMEVEP